jgi:hypothetical protein
MDEIEMLLSEAAKQTGVTFKGLERKSARIRHGMGSDVKDILGWDIVAKDDENTCYAYYVAQPPLMGMSNPEPVLCPLGIVAFDKYNIDITEAVKIFHTQNGGDKFTAITLAWPLTFPQAPEPYWYFKTNLGVDVVIGANSGEIKRPVPVMLYMAQPK